MNEVIVRQFGIVSKGMLSRVALIGIVLFVLCGIISGESFAGTVSKNVENTHYITMSEKPLLITIAVKVKDSYNGTYKDSDGKRVFSKHKETVTFSSHNDRYLVNQLNPSIGYVTFHTPSKKIKCEYAKCKCEFYKGFPIFAIKHHCSKTKATCKIRSDAYCEATYVIKGGTPLVTKTVKFKKIAY